MWYINKKKAIEYMSQWGFPLVTKKNLIKKTNYNDKRVSSERP